MLDSVPAELRMKLSSVFVAFKTGNKREAIESLIQLGDDAVSQYFSRYG
jgi:hypothetical protein